MLCHKIHKDIYKVLGVVLYLLDRLGRLVLHYAPYPFWMGREGEMQNAGDEGEFKLWIRMDLVFIFSQDFWSYQRWYDYPARGKKDWPEAERRRDASYNPRNCDRVLSRFDR